MEKVRFACPRCQTVMQTGSDRVGYDVACPHCSHRFKLIAPNAGKDLNSDKGGVSGQANTVGRDAPTIPRASGRVAPNSGFGGPPFKKAVSADGSSDIQQPTTGQILGDVQTAQALVVENPRPAPVGFCCPYCRTTKPPKLKSKVSTVGWVIFTVLLLTTCVLAPIGFLVRDDYRICSQCKITLGTN